MANQGTAVTRDRDDQERAQSAVLAPYAQRVDGSAGRAHPEPPHPWRTPFQRDRARVIHSRAFRRLEYKTQVFLNGAGDHLRTRLTHTIEVASVSRSVACALGLNEDLAEVIALAHDLGHAPVGHAGEEMLDALMRDHGGFEHNLQSLRIVESIEPRYPDFDGLNLSYEVLEGLRKHDRTYRRPATARGTPPEDFSQPSLEAQVAHLADEITYYSHDLDDGLDHQLITPAQLDAIDLWRECRDRVRSAFPALSGKRFLSYVTRVLIDLEVDALITETDARLKAAGAASADDVRRHPTPLAGFTPERRRHNAQLRDFLYQNLYYHPDVARPNREGCHLIERVFNHYLAHPEKLGRRTSERLARDGLHRTVCDYVSGMTDRYLVEEAQRLAMGDFGL